MWYPRAGSTHTCGEATAGTPTRCAHTSATSGESSKRSVATRRGRSPRSPPSDTSSVDQHHGLICALQRHPSHNHLASSAANPTVRPRLRGVRQAGCSASPLSARHSCGRALAATDPARSVVAVRATARRWSGGRHWPVLCRLASKRGGRQAPVVVVVVAAGVRRTDSRGGQASRVLVVDDEQDLLDLLAFLAQQAG